MGKIEYCWQLGAFVKTFMVVAITEIFWCFQDILFNQILVYSGCVETVYGDCKVICTLQPPQDYEEEADATT